MLGKYFLSRIQNGIAIMVLVSLLLSSVRPAYAQDLTPEPEVTPTGEITLVPTEEVQPTEVPTEEQTAIPTEETTPDVTPTSRVGESPTPEATSEPTGEPTLDPGVTPTEEATPEPEITETPAADVTAPSGNITAPLAGTITSSPLQISVDASDTESGVAKVEFYVSTAIPAVEWTLLGTVETAPYAFTWDWSAYEDGDVLLSATVYDVAGNSAVASNPVQVTLEHPISMQAVPANDNMSDAIEIVLDTEYTIDTREATIEAGEIYLYDDPPNGSVWFSFTPTVSGIYTFDTEGTNYEFGLNIFKNESGYPVKVDFGTFDYPELSTFSYTMTAGQPYLIRFLSWEGGGNLNLQVTQVVCPEGALCVTVTTGEAAPTKNAVVKILNSNDEEKLSTNQAPQGYYVLTGVPEGDYTVITSAFRTVSFNDNIHVPGILHVAGDELPLLQLSVKNKNGMPVDPGGPHFSRGGDNFGAVKGLNVIDGIGQINVTPGTYIMQMDSQNNNLLYSTDNFVVPPEGGLQTIDFSTLDYEEFTFNFNNFPGTLYYHQYMYQTNFEGSWVRLDTNPYMDVVLPANYTYTPVVVQFINDSVGEWRYQWNMPQHTFTGSNDITTGFGGTLTPEISFYTTPFELNGSDTFETGSTAYTSIKLKDAYGNNAYYLGLDDESVNPSFIVNDPEGSIIPGNFAHVPTVEAIEDAYQFDIPSDAPLGQGQVSVSVNTGDWHGELTNSKNFTVIQGIPNDEIGDAILIESLPYLHTQSTNGATPDDPAIPYTSASCAGSGFNTVWYKFIPPASGVYRLDEVGTDYNMQYQVLQKNGDTYDLVLCSWVAPSNSNITEASSFYATEGAEYFITAADNVAGGSLTLGLTEVPCTEGAICLAMSDHQGFPAANIKVSALDSEETILGYYYGDSTGYVEIGDLPEGDYDLLISSTWEYIEEDFVRLHDVHSPGTYPISSIGYQPVQFIAKDINGNPENGYFFLTNPARSWISEYWVVTYPDQPGVIYPTPGEYSVYFWGDNSVYLVNGINITGDPGQVVTIDASTMDYETFTYSDMGSELDYLVYYPVNTPPEFYWNAWSINLEKEAQSVLALPAGTYFDLSGGFDREDPDTGMLWNFMYGNLYGGEFAGGHANTDFPMGGTLYLSPSIQTSVIRPGGFGQIFPGLMDQYDHPIYGVNTWDDPDFNSISPTFTLRNPDGVVVDGHFEPVDDPSVGSNFKFIIPSGGKAGTWSITTTLDLGPYQEDVSYVLNFTVQNSLPNDNMANAKVVSLTNGLFTHTMDTSGATVEAGEPQNRCNSESTGSVWYKFTPTVGGIYSIDTHGTNYSHAISVVKNDSSKTLATCFNTESDPNGTPIAYQFAANQTYLIGISDQFGGGELTFKLKKESCPANALCVTATGDGKWYEKYAVAFVLDRDNNVIADGATQGNGFSVVSKTRDGKIIPPGKYSVIVWAFGFFIKTPNVSIPGNLSITASNYLKVEVDFRDTSGNLLEADTTIVSLDGIYGLTHPFWSYDKLYLYLSPGTYDIQMANQGAMTVIAKTDIPVVSNGKMDFDVRNIETEQYTFNLEGVTEEVFYHLDLPRINHWGNLLKVANGDTVTVGMPMGVVFRPELSLGIDNWWYSFSLEDHKFTGDSDLTATLGGVLNPEFQFIDQPFRPGDEQAIVRFKPHDENDFYLEDVWNGSSNGTPEYEVWNSITETLIKNSSNAGLEYLSTPYQFDIDPTVGVGDWKIKATLDTGPLQGDIFGEAVLPVYDAPPNANDLIANAEVITSLPFNPTEINITGSTTSADDPTIPGCGVGQGIASIWYQYTPAISGVITIDTIGSDFDTVVAIWKGTPGHLEFVQCNDDIGLGVDLDSQVTNAVRAGETYYIEVMEGDGKISAQRLGGLLNLHITQGDLCYALNTGLNLPAGGTIIVDPVPNCLGDLYLDGTSISLRVAPKTGYTFQYWADTNGTQLSTANPWSGINIEADTTYIGMLLVKPGLPTLASPGDGALVPSLTPTFNWTDSSPGADHYRLQIATDIGFNTVIQDVPDLDKSIHTIKVDLTPNTTYYWHVKAFGLGGELESAWTSRRSFRTKLATPELVAPLDLSESSTTRPTFQWNAVNGTNNYTLQISKHDNFTTPVLTYTVIGTSFTPPVDLTPTNTTLYWRVKANGTNQGDYSAPWSFTSANPPRIPTLTVPLSNALMDGETDLELQWIVTYSVGVDHYDLQVSKTNSFLELLVDIHTPTMDYSIDDPLDPNQTYFWRVRSVAADGDYSRWSGVRYFHTRMLPPTPITPENASNAEITRPTFTWSTVVSATSYTLQISVNEGFEAPAQTIQVAGLSYTPTIDLPKDAIIFWRVMANGKNPSLYSEKFNFHSANPPAIPVLLSPQTGTLLDTYAPTLTWKAGTGSPVVVASYIIQIAKNSTFTAEPKLYTVYDGTGFTFSEDLEPNVTWYWRMRSAAGVGEGGVEDKSLWSATRTFRTRMMPPTLITPISNTETHTIRPVFQWDAVPGATSYTLLVAENNAFSLGLKTFTTSYSTYTPSVDLPRNKAMYWKVRANGTNASKYSGSDTFITGNPPAIPLMLSPANGVLLTDTTPTFTWRMGTSPVAITEYELQIASNAGFTEDEATYKTGSPVSTYTLTSELAGGKTWYWRVRSYGGIEYSGWTIARTFKEKINPPVLISPANLEVVNDYTPTLDWGAVNGAVTYTLQVSRNSTFSSLLKNMSVTGEEYTFETELLPNQILYWRVKTNGAAFASNWSAAYRFDTGEE